MELFDMLSESTELRDHLEEVTSYYRQKLDENGFDVFLEHIHVCRL